MVYVTMTDKRFTKAWQAICAANKGMICKYVYECETPQEADIVAANAMRNSDQKDVNISMKKPSYNSKKYKVTWRNKENDSNWYIPGGVR